MTVRRLELAFSKQNRKPTQEVQAPPAGLPGKSCSDAEGENVPEADDRCLSMRGRNSFMVSPETCSYMFAPSIQTIASEICVHREEPKFGIAVMSDLSTVIAHFQMHELTIRRLYGRMPEFRSLCEDYATARTALERWRTDEQKLHDFRLLTEEIESEIEEFIQGALNRLRENQSREEN